MHRRLASLLLIAANVSAQQIDWLQNPSSGRWYGATYQSMTWPDARSLATSQGARLVTIRSAAEQSWIQSNFTSYIGSRLWIGFTDAQLEGQWVWDSGEPVTYTNWASGQPNGGANENHAVLETNWTWHDWPNTSSGPRALLERATAPARAWSWPSFFSTGSSGAEPEHAAIGDLDGDEDLDIAVPNRSASTITIHRNNGSGVFTLAQTITSVGTVRTLLARDLDGDGDLDLIGADSSGSVFACYYNAGSFASRVTLASVPDAHGLAAADFNGDGRLDLVVSSLSPDGHVRILLQQPNGIFSIAQTYAPPALSAYQPTLANLDGDQHLDLVIAHSSGVSILRGLGGGAFAAPASLGSSEARRVAVGDIDGDGDMDLVVGMLGRLNVWKNQGGMTFTLFSNPYIGGGFKWASLADVDADGDLDVVGVVFVINPSYYAAVRVLRNDGAGTMSADFVLEGQNNPRWAECADINSDGWPDILCTCDSGFSVNRNSVIPASHVPASVVWSSTVPTAGPSPRHSASTASRPSDFLLFGGFSTAAQNDTWRFDLTGWQKLYPFLSPAKRYDHALAYDAARNEVLLFGGRNPMLTVMSDTWTWDGVDWVLRQPIVAPPARREHRMAFDAARGVVVLYGGRDATAVRGDTWTWDGTAWQQLAPAASPPARANHGLAYDSLRQRVVLFGGEDAAGALFGDVWEWNGTAWARRTGLAGGPGPSADHAMIYDPIQQRVLVQGGRQTHGLDARMFAYDGSQWVQVVNASGAPAARDGHQMAVIGGEPRIHIFGGAASSPTYPAMWTTTLPSFARFDAFGTGCLGSGGVPSLVPVGLPKLGQNFTIGVNNPPQNLVLGFGTFGYSKTTWGSFIPLPAEMTFLGMPGCRLFVDPVIVESFPAQQPMPLWSYPIPSNINLLGLRFYAQAMLLDPLVPNPQNTMQAVMTNALEGVVGY